MTTIDEAIRLATRRLSPCSSSARLDSELLLGHVLNQGRASLLAHFSDNISEANQRDFDALVGRRSKGEPVAYLTGHKEFYGLDFVITEAVLVPRPETESVIEVCLELLPNSENSQLADIGTGSGAIMVAVAKNRPNVRVYGTEISPDALEIARRNCEQHGLGDRARLYLGNLLEPIEGKMDAIAANLPYVPPGEASPDVALWEPNVAVFGGGNDGIDVIRQFLDQAPNYLVPGGAVVMEVAHSQGETVSELARSAFPSASVEVRKDLAGYDRIVIVKTT